MLEVGIRKLNATGEKYKNLLVEDINTGVIKTEVVNTCLCCSSSELEQLLSIDRFGLPFGSHICQNCGLVVTSPRIKQESLPYYYDTYYHPLNYGKENLDKQPALFGESQGVKIFEKIKPYINKKNFTVIEIGAGVGNVLKEFQLTAAKSGLEVEVIGTEYSQQCIARCEENGIETIFGDVHTAVSLGKCYDIVILSHVFEHFISLNKELQGVSKILKGDGLLYVEVPGILKNHAKPYYDFSFLGYSVHAHMYNFTLRSLENVIGNNGFSLLKGNEEVSAIFRVSSKPPKGITSVYNKVKYYFEFLADNQQFALSQNKKIASQGKKIASQGKKIASQGKNIASQGEKIGILTRSIENNTKTIQDLKEIIRLKNVDIRNIYNAKEVVVSAWVLTKLFRKYKAYKKLVKVIDSSQN